MKRPITLLVGVIICIVVLSIIFPSDPQKPSLIDKINNTKKQRDNMISAEKAEKSYRIGNTIRIDDTGRALVWDKDEKHIYYSKPVKDSSEEGLEELWFSDLKGNKQKIDINIKLYNILSARLSPDGNSLAFISNRENKNNLYLYNMKNKSITDITPKKILDEGVTSYDWDDESLNIIMSVDVSKPRIEIYSLASQKASKIDIDVKNCKNVFFYKDGKIIFSDKDSDGKYKIYSAERSGKGREFIIEGQDFIISPDRQKIALLSDENGKLGLWVYYSDIKRKESCSLLPVYNVYWMSNSVNLMYSTLQDTMNKNAYRGIISYVEKGGKITKVYDVLHPVFVASQSGRMIAMTSTESLNNNINNKGIFIGELNK